MSTARTWSAVGLVVVLACCWRILTFPVRAQTAPASAPALTITTESLPPFTVQQQYRFRLDAMGGVPPLQWSVSVGKLPDGIDLDPEAGVLSGVAVSAGEFDFTVTVTDSGVPAHAINKEFTGRVMAPLLLDWKNLPRVQDNRIEGSVVVSNGTQRDIFDLTVIIVAVSEVGKAFALGYQRFDLKPGTTNLEIPFGSTLPVGAYIVHADAIAEIAAERAIFRRRMQTPTPLRITVGP
jgi:putative Ig domain-containing protein